MRIVFVSCTRANNGSDTVLGQCFAKQFAETGRSQELRFHTNNSDKLSAVYNKYISDEYKDAIVVFVHDDVELDVLATSYALNEAFREPVSVVGLAGGIEPRITAPALWHIMCGRGKLSGAVAHVDKNSGLLFMTAFGLYPQRVDLLDGLFLAVRVKDLLEKGVKFDESNPAIAHFYDLDFCMAVRKAGLTMTTWPIYVAHRSPGLSDMHDVAWNAGQRWFLNKWATPVKLF